MSNKELVEKYIGTLEHFLIPELGGWPIVGFSRSILKDIPSFIVNKDGRLIINPKKEFNKDLLIEFWKFKFEESERHNDEMYNRIKTLVNDL